MTVIDWIVASALGVFTVRRYIYWFGSILPRRPDPADRTRSIVVLVAARNEQANLPRLLAALERTDYPADQLDFVLVSDGSGDATPAIISDWVAGRPRAKAVILAVNRGKGGALQAAYDAAPPSDLVAVFDADTTPEPDALASLAGAFDDPAVGAACGYPDPGFAHATIVARYAALERWVVHLVMIAGKDRLGFQPPMIGALCAIRTAALNDIGGFPNDTVVEDIHVSMALARKGWKIRWVRDAVAREDVPQDINGFRLQRLRWSRGLMSSGKKAKGLEDVFVAAGYMDRLALVTGVVLSLSGGFPAWLPAAYVIAPMVVVVTALWRAAPPNKLDYLWSIIPMTFADLAVTVEATVAQITGAPLRWDRR